METDLPKKKYLNVNKQDDGRAKFVFMLRFDGDNYSIF
jgi:hypothetical protein